MSLKEFHLDAFLSRPENGGVTEASIGSNNRFIKLCDEVRKYFSDEWDREEELNGSSMKLRLEREKNAIIGREKEVNYYKDKIFDFLRERRLQGEWYPSHYMSLVDAIFHENYGLAGLAPWAYDASEELKNSSSAKIIGENIFFMKNGKYELQPQKISSERRKQLKTALLLKTPKERLDKGFHEVYMERGNIRITIFSGDRTKEGQDVMVFRKYVVKDLTFEGMAELGTFPPDAIPLFKSMIDIGFNVMFAGAVRTGKTTFLVTWQKYEDPSLEGLAIATDPENNWYELMPGAPIMQIVADDKELEGITKSLLRGDNDYVIIEECRDATAFNIAQDITTTGTRRSKMTIHVNRAVDIPYKMGSKIVTQYGGDLNAVIAQVFQNWNYVFEFAQLEDDKSKKKLTGISEFRYDAKNDEVSIHEICKYDFETDTWSWKYDIGDDKAFYGKRYPESFSTMKKQLMLLESRNPIVKDNVIKPAYYHPVFGGGN